MKMRVVDIIAKKRDGMVLTAEEIHYFVQGVVNQKIPDYQISAWLMAVYLQGMTPEETVTLTLAMAQSGRMIDLSDIPGIKIDKHSTGGVGDTTTLVVAPLVAAAGIPVAKMSGRGLGFTGGTIDKLEAIPGFSSTLDMVSFSRQIRRHNLAVISQSVDLAPADGLLYALRDVTATVESIPLIASSIMSKKIAAGADKILLDVKVGNGAFMHDLQDAILLAQTMVDIGKRSGKETAALLTGMDEPLGCAVGNALEVQEAIDILSGRAPGRLQDLCLTLGAHMLIMANVENTLAGAREKVHYLLSEGLAIKKFTEFIEAQGGDPEVVVKPGLLPTAAHQCEVFAKQDGYVSHIETAGIGQCAVILGAGREYKGQPIDLAAGLVMKCRIGDYVRKGQPLAVLYANQYELLEPATEKFVSSIAIVDQQAFPTKLVLGLVDSSGTHLFD